jgi:hypothetical protein
MPATTPNSDRNDQRNAVTNSPLGDLLTEPHNEHRTRRQSQNCDEPESPPRSRHRQLTAWPLHALEEDRDTNALDDRQQHCSVTSVLRDLLAAFFAFLCQLLEVRDNCLKKLQDNRRANVRHNAERKDRCLLEISTGEKIV